MRGFFLSIVLLIFSLVNPVFGWHVNTHLQMTRDAIALMPEDFQKIFKEHPKFTESGIRDPDELLKDWQNHYFIPAIPEGGALERVEKLSATIQTKIKSGNTTDLSKQLCYLAHYIGDLWTPEDSVRQASRTGQDFMKNNDIVVFYEGYPGPIQNFHDYFVQRSIWRWRLESSKEIEPLLYSEAVNDIARAWLTLWEQNGKAVAAQKATVIDHKRGVLTANFERLLLEEKYDGTQWDVEGSPLDKYRAHMEEMKRLSEGASPSEEALAAKAQMRNQELMMSKLGAGSPFAMIETSLRRVGDKSYLVARIRNRSDKDVVALSLMYPGVRGAVAQVKDLKAGQIAKLEGVLPADARKDQIQLIFATLN